MNDPLPASRAAGQIVETAESRPDLDLEPITRMLGASYALLFRMNVADGQVGDAASHGVDVGYVARLREAGRERMLPGWLGQLESGSVIDRALFGSDHQFARTAFFNHVIRPEGRFHCIIATPFRARAHRLHLVIGKPQHRPGFDAEDRGLFRRMLPLVNEVIQARSDLAQSEAAARSAFGISEAWTYPVIVASEKGVVQYANQWARQLLAASDALVVDAASRLRSVGPLNDHKLRHAFTAAMRTGRQQTVLLQSPTVSQPLRLTIRWTHSGLINAIDRPVGWFVISVEDHGQGITDEAVAAVGRQYGLTTRESALLSCLIKGVHLKTACSQLGMSYNTGRCHLRQIFAKTDTHRQGDLVRICMTDRLLRRQDGSRHGLVEA